MIYFAPMRGCQRKLPLVLIAVLLSLSGVAPTAAELLPVPQNLVALDSNQGEQLLFGASRGRLISLSASSS